MLKVALGRNQNLTDSLRSVTLDLFNPTGDVLEGLFIIDGISKDDSSSSFVVGLSDISESFLSGGVPDLKFDFRIINVDCFEFEVDSDSGYIAVFEDSIAEFGEKVGFTDSTVTDDDDFSKKIVLVFGHGMISIIKYSSIGGIKCLNYSI